MVRWLATAAALMLASHPLSPQQAAPLAVLQDVGQIEEKLATDAMAQAIWLKSVALAFNAEPGPELTPLQQEVAAVLRLRGERLARRDADWPAAQADAYLALLLIDPRRFAIDSDFRANVTPVLRDGLSELVPVPTRHRMMRQLGTLEFGPSERLAVAWGLALRTSRDREVLFGSWPARIGSAAPIRASIYSLPSRFFLYEDAARFLRGVHELAPDRSLVVLSDAPLVDRLRPLVDELPLDLIDTYSRHYTPWPRDPFALVNEPSGAVTLLVRPNAQARREGDAFMARELVRGLPDGLDRAWGRVEWSAAPVPFHGGHTLATPGTTWASIHTLLPRIIELMGENPTPAGLAHALNMARFRAATDTARAEFEAVFEQPVRFVHPLPDAAGNELDPEVMLVGGGTSDLDSLVAVLPGPDGRLAALVADFELGRRLLADVPEGDLEAFGDTYHLVSRGSDLRDELVEQAPTAANRLIQEFLDVTAGHLAGEGIEVRRVPLLHVPEGLVEAEFRLQRDGFLVTWTNVVLEAFDDRFRAEGFAGGLPSLDAEVTRIFRESGYELRLTPTLALSVMRDGGYRCASNHVR